MSSIPIEILLPLSERFPVTVVHVVPPDEVRMVPELPTATKSPVSTLKEVNANVLLTFPAESVTVIVQLE